MQSSSKVETINVNGILFFDILSSDSHTEIVKKALAEEKRMRLFHHPDKSEAEALPNRLKVVGVSCPLTDNHKVQLSTRGTVIFEKRAAKGSRLMRGSSSWYMHYYNVEGRLVEQLVDADNEKILRVLFGPLDVDEPDSITLSKAENLIEIPRDKRRFSLSPSTKIKEEPEAENKSALDVVKAFCPDIAAANVTGEAINFIEITAAADLVKDQHQFIASCRPQVQDDVSGGAVKLLSKFKDNIAAADIERYLDKLGSDETRYLVMTHQVQIGDQDNPRWASVLALVLAYNRQDWFLVFLKSFHKSPELLDQLIEEKVENFGDEPALVSVIVARYFCGVFSVDFYVELLKILPPKSRDACLSGYAALGECSAVDEQAVVKTLTTYEHNIPGLHLFFDNYCQETISIFMNARGNEDLLVGLYGEEGVARLVAAKSSEKQFRQVLEEYTTAAKNHLRQAHYDKENVYRELYGYQAAARLAVVSDGETVLSDLFKRYPGQVFAVLNVLDVGESLQKLRNVSDKYTNKPLQILVSHNHIDCFSKMLNFLARHPEDLQWHLATCLYDIFSFTDKNMQVYEEDCLAFEALYEEAKKLFTQAKKKRQKEAQQKSAHDRLSLTRLSLTQLSSEELEQKADGKITQANEKRRSYEARRIRFDDSRKQFVAAIPKKIFKNILKVKHQELLNFALENKNSACLIAILEEFDVSNYLDEISKFLCNAVTNKDPVCFGEIIMHLFSGECLEAISSQERETITSGKRLALTAGSAAMASTSQDSQQAMHFAGGGPEVVFINRLLINVLIAIFTELDDDKLRTGFLFSITSQRYLMEAMLHARDENGFSVLHAAFEYGAKSFMRVMDYVATFNDDVRLALTSQVKEKFDSVIREQEAKPEDERNVREIKENKKRLLKLFFLTSDLASFKQLLSDFPQDLRLQLIKDTLNHKDETVFIRALGQKNYDVYIDFLQLLPATEYLAAIEASLDSSRKSLLAVLLDEKELERFREVFSLLPPADQETVALGRLWQRILELALDEEDAVFYKEIIVFTPLESRFDKVKAACNSQFETILQWASRTEKQALLMEMLGFLPESARVQVVSPPRCVQQPRRSLGRASGVRPVALFPEAPAGEKSLLGGALKTVQGSLLSASESGVSDEVFEGDGEEADKGSAKDSGIRNFIGLLCVLDPSSRLTAIQNQNKNFLVRNVKDEVVPIEDILKILPESDHPAVIVEILPGILALERAERKSYFARLPNEALMKALGSTDVHGIKYFCWLKERDQRRVINRFLIKQDDGQVLIKDNSENPNAFAEAFSTVITIRPHLLSREITTSLANYIYEKVHVKEAGYREFEKVFSIIFAYCNQDVAALKEELDVPRGYFSATGSLLFAAVEGRINTGGLVASNREASSASSENTSGDLANGLLTQRAATFAPSPGEGRSSIGEQERQDVVADPNAALRSRTPSLEGRFSDID